MSYNFRIGDLPSLNRCYYNRNWQDI